MSDIEAQAPEDVPGIDRRVFMGLFGGGLGGAALVGAAAATAWPAEVSASVATPTEAAAPTGEATADHGGGHEGLSVDEMDDMHKQVVDQFLENIERPITRGVGATDLEYRMEDGVRVFELTVMRAEWEVTPGQVEQAITYNGIVPGPTIRCVEGEPVRIHVKNDLDQSTSVHWHGQRVPNSQDGMPFLTQPPIKPGETFTYEFVPGPFGSHMYHSHHNATEQVTKGLLGALLVEPRDQGAEPAYDKDELYILNDVIGGFTVNGKGFPATPAYLAKEGERVRFRFMNEGLMVHPIHLHGLTFEVFARDGYPLPQPFRCDTITVAPGERWDAIVVADNPGAWAFHCHILSHAESAEGMFGMVSVFIVE